MDLNEKLCLKKRILFTGIVTLLVWVNLIWDYLHKGVPIHHILHRADLPGMSNWWGGIAVPLITWFLLIRIAKRVNNNKTSGTNELNNAIYGFFGALLFGIILSFLFTIGSNIPGYMMIGVILVSLFIPLYKAEFLLGFVIGMAYTFGGVLPVGIGILLTIIFTIAYKFVSTGILYLVSKIGSKNKQTK
jgi:hypothetical protein